MLDEAMIVAEALIGCGEARSWASVWWAYAALHCDMSDEALRKALDLLARVDRPSEARAAVRRLWQNCAAPGALIKISAGG